MREESRSYEKLTPEQQKELDSTEEVKYYKQRDEHREAESAKANELATQQAGMTSEVIDFTKRLNIDDARLVALRDELEELFQ